MRLLLKSHFLRVPSLGNHQRRKAINRLEVGASNIFISSTGATKQKCNQQAKFFNQQFLHIFAFFSNKVEFVKNIVVTETSVKIKCEICA